MRWFIALTPLQDVKWFTKAMDQVRKEDLEDAPVASSEPFFVDFLREPPEPTGEEPEDADFEAPKIYELVCVCVCVLHDIVC